jgi:cobalamin biosynthesis protein CobD/CbiB
MAAMAGALRVQLEKPAIVPDAVGYSANGLGSPTTDSRW